MNGYTAHVLRTNFFKGQKPGGYNARRNVKSQAAEMDALHFIRVPFFCFSYKTYKNNTILQILHHTGNQAFMYKFQIKYSIGTF